MSALTPVFSTSFTQLPIYKDLLPSLDQNRTITLLRSDKVAKKEQIRGLLQVNKRLIEVINKLQEKNSSEYRSLKNSLQTKQATELLIRNVTSLDLQFKAYNERYSPFIKRLLSAVYFVVNLFRGCVGYEKIQIDCKRVNIDQFSKIVKLLTEENIRESVYLEKKHQCLHDFTFRNNSPKELINDENLVDLELGKIHHLQFTLSNNSFSLHYDRKAKRFMLEVSGPYGISSGGHLIHGMKYLTVAHKNFFKTSEGQMPYSSQIPLIPTPQGYVLQAGNATLRFTIYPSSKGHDNWVESKLQGTLD